MTSKIAFDRTARHVDNDGRLHIDSSHISKATVNPYYGKEIPNYIELRLDPDKVYYLFRDPVELERGADSFARLPILSKHVHVTADSVINDKTHKDLIIGAIGSNVEFKSPYLDADLCFWDASAIAGIETDEIKELSCAYRYDAVMEAGEHDGKPYDGRMTNIRGSHLALVQVGRAGSDVVVSDHNPFTQKETTMKMTALGKALFAAFGLASPVLAKDSDLPALVGQANRKSFDKGAVKAKVLALDENMDAEQVDKVIDAILDVEQDPEPTETPKVAEDESPADKAKALLAGKIDDETLKAILALFEPVAEDSYDEEKVDEKIEIAKDAMRKEFQQASVALADVRPYVGDVIGMDSAEAIYGFALDSLKVDRAGVEGVPALRALLKASQTNKAPSVTPKIATDVASVKDALARFPNLKRFS